MYFTPRSACAQGPEPAAAGRDIDALCAGGDERNIAPCHFIGQTKRVLRRRVARQPIGATPAAQVDATCRFAFSAVQGQSQQAAAPALSWSIKTC
jgi:hypothetical protein